MSFPSYRDLVPPQRGATHADFLKTFAKLTRRRRPEQAFGDFVEMSALAISNRLDHAQAEGREQRYLALINGYEPDEQRLFPQLFADMKEALSREFHDFFGGVWTALELNTGWAGQVWTPYHVSSLMARMVLSDAKEKIEAHGFISVSEPACGPGGMIVAAAEELNRQGIDYMRHLHVTAQDIDLRCVHMAYIATSLYAVPAMIHVGDTLRGTCTETWFTPMHVSGSWSARLRRREQAQQQPEDEAPLLAAD